jgi:hypothetical protein
MQSFQDFVTGVQVEQVGAPSKRWMYLPGFLLIGLLVMSQLYRMRREQGGQIGSEVKSHV